MQGTAKERYEKLALKREPFLRRARDAAKLTLPSILLPEGHDHTSKLAQPYQGVGARGVINLSSRLLLALLPPGFPFFKLTVPAETLQAAGEQDVPENVQQGMALSEKLITTEIEKANWRRPTNLILQLLIVTGNACEEVLPSNRIKTYRLDQYVVVRDHEGNVQELITREMLDPDAIPDGISIINTSSTDGRSPELFTHVLRNSEGTYDSYQEVNGQRMNEGTYENMPYNVLRWSEVPGEDYGRGKVEEHFPDIMYLEALSKSVLEGSIMASRNFIMIRPNATGNLRRNLAKSPNGAFIVGNPEDVEPKQFANMTGMQIAQIEIDRITQQLSAAFLNTSGRIRDAERVTAAEIRTIVDELEGTLGGVYSMLSEDMQRSRLDRLIVSMQRSGKLLPWPKEFIEPQVIVGLEALNRERDVVRVQTALSMLQGMPPEVHAYVPFPDLLKRLFIGLGLPGEVRSDEEAAQILQQQAQAQAQQQQQAGAEQV